MTDYSEDLGTLQKRWSNTESGKKAIAAQTAQKRAEQERLEAEAKAKQKPTATPPQPKDNTPASQRLAITSVRNNAKAAAQLLHNQINGISLNSKTDAFLQAKINNQNIAYILEEYPDLVTDIDDELFLDIDDVRARVINPLNSRLRELGMNKHCIPNDLSKYSMEQIQKACNGVANIIRNTDKENGYVFKPTAGNEGKVHQPRKESQRGHVAMPKAKKTVSKTPAKAPASKAPAPAKAKQNDTYKYLSMSEMSYPKNLQDRLVELRRYGIEVTVTPMRDGYKLDLNENANNMERFTRPMFGDSPLPATQKNVSGLPNLLDIFGNEKSLILDKDGNLKSQNQKYTNRTVVTNYDKSGRPILTETKYPQSVSYGRLDAQRSATDNVSVKIGVRRPEHLNKRGTKFADSLEQNKTALMKKLGLNNEQYDNLANLAMGIAEQETHFGDYIYKDTEGNLNMQKRYFAKQCAKSVGWNIQSKGLTQIRWALNFEGDKEPNPTLKAQAEAFGIHSEADFKDSPEKTAILTMILLNNRRISAEGKTWQNRLATNNAKLKDPKLHMTTNDIIVLSWNGLGAIAKRFDDPNDVVTIKDNNSGKKDKNGNEIKDGTSYARNVRAYSEHFYNISEDAYSRNRANSLGAVSQGNNGQIGSVVFMPSAYTTNVTNNKKDIQILQDALAKINMPQEDKDKLLMAVRKNEISFGYGLKPEEAASITAKDAKLMLNKLDTLKTRIANLVDPAKIRKEAKAIQDDFRKSYLQSRQVVVNNRDVPAGSIIPALASGDVVNERLKARGEREIIINNRNLHNFRGNAKRSQITADNGHYYGFGVEADKGINPYDANGNYIPERQRILAECASDVAAIMDCGGVCTTGVKASLESAGVVGHRSEIKFVEADGSTNFCKKAKELVHYFDAHPEKFEEVKYVSLGNGTSRELNATDIKHLPAGYIGVFIPGPGYEKQAGHAFITNGNGQGYADEVDNLRWDDFTSGGAGNGKGEHGSYKIYRLKASATGGGGASKVTPRYAPAATEVSNVSLAGKVDLSNRPLLRNRRVDASGNVMATREVFQPTSFGPLSGKTIIVNAGHGYTNKASKDGIDRGTLGQHGIEDEWLINYDNAMRLKNQLCAQGAKVIFLQGAKTLISDELEKGENKADMFISVHVNSADKVVKDRTEIYYAATETAGVTSQSRNLAAIMERTFDSWIPEHEGIAKQDMFIHKNKQDFAMTKSADLEVIRNGEKLQQIPSVLWEIGYMNSLKGTERMANNNLMENYSQLMTNSIIKYFKKD